MTLSPDDKNEEGPPKTTRSQDDMIDIALIAGTAARRGDAAGSKRARLRTPNIQPSKMQLSIVLQTHCA